MNCSIYAGLLDSYAPLNTIVLLLPQVECVERLQVETTFDLSPATCRQDEQHVAGDL